MFKSRFVSRRALIADAGKLTLSAGAVALLAGREALATSHTGDPGKDAGILNVALGLELGAVNASLGVIPAFGDHELAKVAGRLAADETMHYTALTQALGGKLPESALSFGG